jgi:serine/threonine protein phosphatase PrpC
MSDGEENKADISPEDVTTEKETLSSEPIVEETDVATDFVLATEYPAPEPTSFPLTDVTEFPAMEGLPSCGFVTEKKLGLGEDCEPVEFVWEYETGRRTLLAVFDGMGGAGSRKVPDINNPDSTVSMAYLASRAARGAVIEACKQLTPKMQPGEVVEIIGQHIQKYLQRLANREGGIPTGSMRGSMIKDYPTTVAVAIIEEGVNRSVHMMWAGDSRVYAIWPDQQFLLQQLTLDHTASGASSDGGDAALTRCATPDSVNLEYVNIEVPSDAIVFVATDGCFAYESTQFFLTTLIEQLDRSTDELQYSKNLATALSSISGDDCSMAMSFPPTVQFDSLKNDLAKQLRHLQDIRTVPRNNPFLVFSSGDFFLKHLNAKSGG